MKIEWLVGLMEGEGCFSVAKSGSSGKYTTPLMSLVMTDKDVLDKASHMMNAIGRRALTRCKRRLPSGKIAYQAQTTGLPATRIMMTLLPHMGKRRSAMIRSILRSWQPKIYKDAIDFKNSIRHKL